MESSRAPLVTAPAFGLAELLRCRGPFLTLYLVTDAAVENAAHLAEEHWKAPRRALRGQGAPDALLERVDPLVGRAHLEGLCLAAAAAADGELLVEHFLEPPVADLARWAPLPWLVPLLEWRQRDVPHLVVLVDRTGADVLVVDGPGPDRDVEVRGSDDVISQTAPGGWSQRRYQQRAIDSWEHNAGEVADAVGHLADAIAARLVVMAGDVRARHLVRDRLPERLSALVRFAAGGSAVCTALTEARVDTLVVAGDPLEEPTAWFGPDPVPVAVSASALRQLGVVDVEEAPLVDVAVRAALGTDAAVRVVPGAPGLENGLGALLRW